MKKIDISEYDKDNPVPVLLWGKGWANPFVGMWGEEDECYYLIWHDGFPHIEFCTFMKNQPTHFTPIKPEKEDV